MVGKISPTKEGVRKETSLSKILQSQQSTVRFAAELGYEVTLVKDAIVSFAQAEADASLQFNMPVYANAIVRIDEIVAKLAGFVKFKASPTAAKYRRWRNSMVASS
jgi:hypothetical protein